VTEAQLYGDPRLPALVETLEALRTELATDAGLGLRTHGRLVGAVRRRQDGDQLHVGRLAVAPDLQGRGLGSRLLAAVEDTTTAATARLFTGHLSAGNLRLYARHGYVEERRERVHDRLTLVHLAKPLRTSS
jgi:predicted N-acetyltransferase YhbS